MGEEQIEQAETILNCERYRKQITLQNEVLRSLSLRCIKINSNRKIL